eukprot:61073-Prymnesium_polylepis.1
MQNLFLPAAVAQRSTTTPSSGAHVKGGGARCSGLAEACQDVRFYTKLVVVNAAFLPLLPLLPLAMEVAFTQWQRQRLQKTTPGDARFLFIVWLMPCGAFTLWAASQLALAVLLSTVRLSFTHFEIADGVTLAYALTMAHNELWELTSDGQRIYWENAFNLADLASVGLLLSHQACHVISLTTGWHQLQTSVAIPLRSLCCLVTWLRLLEVCGCPAALDAR